jgi:pimeloyl-ACP methyl ester carboxylesterase
VLTDIEAAPGVRERAVRFASGGETLVGVLAVPEADTRPSRAVVIVHGWGSSRAGPHDMLVKLARALASRGVSVLRFDMRGRGESTGAVMETDLDAMIDDTVVAAAFLKAEAGVDTVDAVGLCSGANVALGAAAHEGAFDRVAALSILPFQSHKSAMQELRRTGGMFRKVFAKALNPVTWWRLVTGRVRVFRVLKTLFGGEGGKVKTASGVTRNLKDSPRDLMGALAKYKGKLLFVWGGADPEGMGAKAHFEEFAQANDLDARFEVVEGANHNYYSLEWEREAIELAAAFVAGA